VRPTIDAHHHLWQLGRFPYAWLAPDAPPRPFGDHSAIKADYLLDDYRRDMAVANVTASVFVEANAGAGDAGEAEWVAAVADGPAWPAASVGQVDLRRPDVMAVLGAFAGVERLRGIRMSLCWDERRAWRFIDAPDVMDQAAFRAGLAELTHLGLVLDVVVVPGQLAQLADLAEANPGQTIIIDHLGTPLLDTPEEAAVWAAGMERCARAANMRVKLSGLWPIDRGWCPERIAAPVRRVVSLFGPERCLWGSNYPIEKLMCPVADQIANLETVLADLSEGDKNQIFRDTAKRVYRIDL
jgi:predicted TIM-barrel fold metal-dependent hydrolase